eukprot:8409709-Pyramimonas_sp.AAC.1
MLQCLKRVEWSPKHVTEWIDDRGVEISLLYTSPPLIKTLLYEALQRNHERDLAQVVGLAGDASRVCADIVRNVMRTSKKCTTRHKVPVGWALPHV